MGRYTLVMKFRLLLPIVLLPDCIFSLWFKFWKMRIRRLHLRKVLIFRLRIKSFDGPHCRGVFDRDGSQTLYLFVDVKTDGQTTWPAVVTALDPLRQKGWLTSVNGSTIFHRPITVVGTGSILIYSVDYRKYSIESIGQSTK